MLIKMIRHQKTTSVTIDELFAPSGRPTEISGTSLERKRFERTKEDRTKEESC
jgi:hypothetical protein